MKLLVCVFALVSVAYGRRIVGGQDADIGDFPYQISLEWKERHSCGGSILSSTKILTAAHCTLGIPLNQFRVRAGSSLREEGGQVVNVLRITEHPDYNNPMFDNDLSIVILEEPLQFNDNVKTIEISELEDVEAGTLATVTGWGVNETGLLSKHLKKLEVPRHDNSECIAAFSSLYNPDTQVCYGGIVGQDSCSVAYARRIVGGDDAEIADFPYQISLEVNGAHSCGGTILNPTKILTAAHCTQPFALNSLSVRAGSSLREEGGQVVNVLRKIEHPHYTEFPPDNDVAVLILDQPLELNHEVQTIEISNDEDVPVGILATLTGWGVTETGERAKHLQKLLVPRVEDNRCKNSFGDWYKTDTQTCYGGIRNHGSCSSDSGGPIVIEVRQVGVVSYGTIPCGGSTPGVYTKLFAFRDWIINTN
ncbi:hypothetical protein FQA39_LY14344 [Lamprigera yunnana]|nr:hypothetical protein FQA39_LY14344 [Lamprigera yunnana]